jgi:hypothetical protein
MLIKLKIVPQTLLIDTGGAVQGLWRGKLKEKQMREIDQGIRINSDQTHKEVIEKKESL